MFNALLYKKHPRLYRQKIQTRPPWHYYIALAGLLAAISGGIAQDFAWFASGLSIWLLSTAAFCLTRLRETSRRPSHVLEMLLTSIVIPPLAIYWRLRGAIRYKVFFL